MFIPVWLVQLINNSPAGEKTGARSQKMPEIFPASQHGGSANAPGSVVVDYRQYRK
jgi:hypothetical protein